MKVVSGMLPFRKVLKCFIKGQICAYLVSISSNMHSLGTKMYFFKWYRLSDSFYTFVLISDQPRNLGANHLLSEVPLNMQFLLNFFKEQLLQ